MTIPADLVLVGHVIGAYGLQGWIRIRPYSADADALLHARIWWLKTAQVGSECRAATVLQAKLHSGDTVARLEGVDDRNAAEALKGTTVSVSRQNFPALSAGEFYWIDLIGLTVENLEGEVLGQVIDMMDNGAHPILRVTPPVMSELQQSAEVKPAPELKPEKSAPEILIPYVGQFVQAVDLGEKKITVDWGRDY